MDCGQTFLAFECNGLFVQIHNATTLANMLVKMCTKCTSHKEELERFEEWKEFYKTSVGALHVWSWRMTPTFWRFDCMVWNRNR